MNINAQSLTSCEFNAYILIRAEYTRDKLENTGLLAMNWYYLKPPNLISLQIQAVM